MVWRLIVFGVPLLTPASLALTQEIRPERFEQVLGFELVNSTGVRVRKYNRTTWIFDGTSEVFQDFDDEFKFTLTMAHSPMGNNQWNEYPLKIGRAGVCEILNGPYREYQDHFVEFTNMPRVGDEWFCPFRKGVYWVKEFSPNSDWVLPVIPVGFWRFTGDAYDKEGKLVIRLVGYFHLIRDMFD